MATIDSVKGLIMVVAWRFFEPCNSRLSEPEKSAVNSRICRVFTYTLEWLWTNLEDVEQFRTIWIIGDKLLFVKENALRDLLGNHILGLIWHHFYSKNLTLEEIIRLYGTRALVPWPQLSCSRTPPIQMWTYSSSSSWILHNSTLYLRRRTSLDHRLGTQSSLIAAIVEACKLRSFSWILQKSERI